MKKGFLILSMIFSLAALATIQAVETSTLPVPEATVTSTVLSQTETIAPVTVELEQASETESGFDWLALINIGLLVLTVFFGREWVLVRGKFKELVGLSESVVLAGKELDKVLDDGKITEDERKTLRQNFQIIAEKWKLFIKHKANVNTD